MIKSTCNTDGGFTCLNRSYLINYDDLKDAHSRWVDSEMQNENRNNENKWTQSIAVGSDTFIEKIKKALGYRATGRKIISADDTIELREAITPFGNADKLDSGNTYLWNQPSTGSLREPQNLTTGSIDHHHP